MNHKIRLLLIDDNREIIDMLRLGLETYFIIESAENGEIALEKIYAFKPDIAIVDIKMPHMNGFQFIKAIRGDPATADLPLIILTAMPVESSQFEGFASGADYFLTKPVMPSELLEVIPKIIAINQSERHQKYQNFAQKAMEEYPNGNL